ncbi:hypothetical protein WSM22_36260 [Cytophagales bacterium WSM2-2]|nr:hypothetical protein WSM22_36260 [Cytophagales bacterium WSM2-2]
MNTRIVLFVLACFTFSSCGIDEVPGYTKRWLHDATVQQLFFENGSDTITLDVSYFRTLSKGELGLRSEDIASIFEDKKTSSKLALDFFGERISFTVIVTDTVGGKPVKTELPRALVLTSESGSESIIEGAQYLSIEDNYVLNNITYERVAVISATHPKSYFHQLYYSKRDGLVGFKDKNDKTWTRIL